MATGIAPCLLMEAPAVLDEMMDLLEQQAKEAADG